MNPRDHPLFPQFFDLCRSAMSLVRDTDLCGNRLSHCISKIPGNSGSMIGTLFEYYLGTLLPSEFVPQSGKMDCDFVNPSARSQDFELKTSSQNSFSGNRIASQTTKKESFVLFVQYDPIALTIRSVRFGVVTKDDWIPQKGVGQRSTITRKKIDTLPLCVTKEIPMCFRQK